MKNILCLAFLLISTILFSAISKASIPRPGSLGYTYEHENVDKIKGILTGYSTNKFEDFRQRSLDYIQTLDPEALVKDVNKELRSIASSLRIKLHGEDIFGYVAYAKKRKVIDEKEALIATEYYQTKMTGLTSINYNELTLADLLKYSSNNEEVDGKIFAIVLVMAAKSDVFKNEVPTYLSLFQF